MVNDIGFCPEPRQAVMYGQLQEWVMVTHVPQTSAPQSYLEVPLAQTCIHMGESTLKIHVYIYYTYTYIYILLIYLYLYIYIHIPIYIYYVYLYMLYVYSIFIYLFIYSFFYLYTHGWHIYVCVCFVLFWHDSCMVYVHCIQSQEMELIGSPLTHARFNRRSVCLKGSLLGVRCFPGFRGGSWGKTHPK